MSEVLRTDRELDASVDHAIRVGLGVSTEVPRRTRPRAPADVDVETSKCDENDLG
jgi:hypothetical protein